MREHCGKNWCGYFKGRSNVASRWRLSTNTVWGGGEREKYSMYIEERTEDLPTIMFQKSMTTSQNDEPGEKEE